MCKYNTHTQCILCLSEHVRLPLPSTMERKSVQAPAKGHHISLNLKKWHLLNPREGLLKRFYLINFLPVHVLVQSVRINKQASRQIDKSKPSGIGFSPQLPRKLMHEELRFKDSLGNLLKHCFNFLSLGTTSATEHLTSMQEARLTLSTPTPPPREKEKPKIGILDS